MGQEKTVSVVLIFLNAEKFIGEAIESVLAQTYTQWELILVDDGSTDQGTQIAKDYAGRFPGKIHYLEHPGHQNRGKSASRNLGVVNARGEYLALLDADDVFLPGKLERQAAILDQNPRAAMVYGPTLYWYSWTKDPLDIKRDYFAQLGVEPNRIHEPPQLMTLYLINGGYIPCTCGLLVRRNVLDAQGGSEESFKNLYEDQVFLAKIVLKHPVYVEDKPGDKYRQHPASSSNIALQTGDYRLSQPHQAQLNYFRWLSQYIAQNKFEGKGLKEALNNRLLPYDHPVLWKISQWKKTKNSQWLAHFIFEQKCMPWALVLKWRALLKKNPEEILRNRLSNIKAWRRINERGLVLMYHRIEKLDYDPRQLSVSPLHFEEHLQVIKKYGRAVQMREMGKNLKTFSFGKKEIVITLDDGYGDNFRNAGELLKKNDVPATFFIITGSISCQDEFFWDGLERTILAPQSLPSKFEMMINGKIYRWTISRQGPCMSLDYSKSSEGVPVEGEILSRAQLYSALIRILGLLSAQERKNAVQNMARWASVALTIRPDFLPVTSDELLSMSQEPLFEIGAHTVTHPMLSLLPLERQKAEISQSKQDLETRLDYRITSFSYPHGSYSMETAGMVRDLEFQNACTVSAGKVMRPTDPYQLPRFSVMDWDGGEFEKKLLNWLSS